MHVPLDLVRLILRGRAYGEITSLISWGGKYSDAENHESWTQYEKDRFSLLLLCYGLCELCVILGLHRVDRFIRCAVSLGHGNGS